MDNGEIILKKRLELSGWKKREMMWRKIEWGMIKRRRKNVVGGCVDEIEKESEGLWKKECLRRVRELGKGKEESIEIRIEIECENIKENKEREWGKKGIERIELNMKIELRKVEGKI